ncbi:MAG: TatD family hydrolase [Gemmatimonadota bacterium]
MTELSRPPPLFDSHLHLTDARFEEDRPEVLRRARAVGVTELVTVASDPEDGRAAAALARETAGVWATAGLHPHEAGRWSAELGAAIEEGAGAGKVVAVGETGLDYHYDNAPRAMQEESFRGQMALAERLGLPVVVHSRAADGPTSRVIREFAGRVVGVLHCFTGGDELLAAGLRAGWYVSFSGILTFGDAALEARARRVPEDRLLVETDSPYLAPVPRRGRRNEPAHLIHTCAKLAELRAAAVEEVAEQTRRNARKLYRLSPEN